MKLRKKDKHFLFSQLGFKKSKRRPFHHGIRNDKHGRKQNLVTVRTLPKERRTSTVKESKQTDFQHPRGTGVREMVQPNEDTLLPQRRGRARKRKKIVDDSTPANFILLHKRNREGLPLTQQTSSQPELWHSHSKNTSYTYLQRLQKSKEIPNGCLGRPNQARKQPLKSSGVKKQDSCKWPKTRRKSSAAYAGMTLANLQHLPLSKRIRQLIPGYTSPDEEEFTLEEFCNIETLEEAVEMAARETRSGDEQEPHHQNASTVKKEKSTDSESLLIPSSSGKKRRSKRSSRSPEGSYWDCSVCTYRNKAEAFKCAMCDVRKGTSTRKPRLNAQLVAQQQAQQNLSPLIHVKPVKTTPRGPTPRKAGTTKKPRPRLKNVDRSSAISTEVIVNNVPVIITEFKEKSHTRTTVDSDEASADRTNGNVNGL